MVWGGVSLASNQIRFGILKKTSFRKRVKQLYLLSKSLLVYLKLKLIYGSRITLKAINSIKGKLDIDLLADSKLKIGHFLMTTGPCYIKCIENSVCEIGDNVFMNHNCSITCVDRVTIGDNVIMANNVVIVDHDHKLGHEGVVDGLKTSPVFIGNNVWIGANSVILKSVTIGEGAVIAAGAIVNCNVPAHEIWGGIPARKIKEL